MLLLRGARALRAFPVLGSHQNPRRSLKSLAFHRRHLSLRSPTSCPVDFSRMEEAPISSIAGGVFAGEVRAGISSPAGRRERLGEVDCFELSSSSVLKLQKGDITSWFVDGKTDAIVSGQATWFVHSTKGKSRLKISLSEGRVMHLGCRFIQNPYSIIRLACLVNAANEKMLGGGGVDGAIHRAAGPELKAACYKVPEVQPGVRCPTGEARITPAFQLPVSRVIHTVGPIYGAVDKPEVLLRNAYINSLKLAKENNIHYIAFPAISCGVYRYPYDEASKIAISAIKEFPSDFKEVHFVLFSDDTYRAWLETCLEFM